MGIGLSSALADDRGGVVPAELSETQDDTRGAGWPFVGAKFAVTAGAIWLGLPAEIRSELLVAASLAALGGSISALEMRFLPQVAVWRLDKGWIPVPARLRDSDWAQNLDDKAESAALRQLGEFGEKFYEILKQRSLVLGNQSPGVQPWLKEWLIGFGYLGVFQLAQKSMGMPPPDYEQLFNTPVLGANLLLPLRDVVGIDPLWIAVGMTATLVLWAEGTYRLAYSKLGLDRESLDPENKKRVWTLIRGADLVIMGLLTGLAIAATNGSVVSSQVLGVSAAIGLYAAFAVRFPVLATPVQVGWSRAKSLGETSAVGARRCGEALVGLVRGRHR